MRAEAGTPCGAVELYDLVAGAATETPDRPALSVGSVTWSFAELLARVDALDAYLAARCSTGARVAVLSHNRPEYVAAYYGVPRRGRVLMPLNQRLHPREWVDQIARAGAELVLGEPELLESLRASGHGDLPAAASLDDLPWRTTAVQAESPASAAAAPAAAEPGGAAPATAGGDADGTAWLMFTSGTSGRPKAVRLTHRNLLAGVAITGVGRPVHPGDVFCTPFPLCHVAGYQVMLYHQHRRPVVVLARFSVPDLVAAVAEHGITSLSLAPTMVSALLIYVADDPAAAALLRSQLRVIAYGSAPMPVPLLRQAMETFGCDLIQGFGMTELAGNATFFDGADHRAAVGDRPQLAESAGRAGHGVEIQVVDNDGMPVPVGDLGEIVARGEQVTPGYWNDPQANRTAFFDDPAGPWFRTGDAGRLDAQGYLYVVDRLKDVIITGGENVGSREVEDVLRAVPGVEDVAVVGLPDQYWGQQVCAAVVRSGAPCPDEQQLVEACRARLAGFKVPRRLVFVDELPKTATGKVRKDTLRERINQPAAGTEKEATWTSPS